MGADEQTWRKNPGPEGFVVQLVVPFDKNTFATTEEPDCWKKSIELPARWEGVKISRA